MLRSLSEVCAPLLSSDIAVKTISENTSDTEVMKMFWTLIEYSLLGSKQGNTLRYLVEVP
jgi:hypothetical protein